jgi:hypothetical protein
VKARGPPPSISSARDASDRWATDVRLGTDGGSVVDGKGVDGGPIYSSWISWRKWQGF